MKPPIDNKFVPYGGPNQAIDTEIRGEVIEVGGSNLLIVPDDNYRHMCRPGNLRHPVPGEDGYAADREARAAGRPVIKCELYAVGSRPDPTGGSADPPKVLERGISRPIQVGDHIRMRGLYVTDNSHTMYYFLFTSSFSVMRGLYSVGYVHSEIHPYDYYSIDLTAELEHVNQLAETHTMVAPVYPEIYTSTYEWNKIFGVAGDLVEDAKETTETASFLIRGDPGSTDAHTRRLSISDVVQLGDSPAISYVDSGASDLAVQVTVSGTDVLNPTLYRGTFAVVWVKVMSISYSPDPLPLDRAVQLTFTAIDAVTGTVLDNSVVLFNGQQVGVTGVAFDYTFVGHWEWEIIIGVDGKPHRFRYRAGPDITVTVHHDGYEDYYLPALHY